MKDVQRTQFSFGHWSILGNFSRVEHPSRVPARSAVSAQLLSVGLSNRVQVPVEKLTRSSAGSAVYVPGTGWCDFNIFYTYAAYVTNSSVLRRKKSSLVTAGYAFPKTLFRRPETRWRTFPNFAVRKPYIRIRVNRVYRTRVVPRRFMLIARLAFSAPPTFATRPKDQKVGLNGVASFDCVAQGNPPPSVFWTREGSQVLMFPGNAYGHFHVTQDGTLRIQGAQKEDAGFLVCSALSVAGSVTWRAFLQVSRRFFFFVFFLFVCKRF